MGVDLKIVNVITNNSKLGDRNMASMKDNLFCLSFVFGGTFTFCKCCLCSVICDLKCFDI